MKDRSVSEKMLVLLISAAVWSAVTIGFWTARPVLPEHGEHVIGRVVSSEEGVRRARKTYFRTIEYEFEGVSYEFRDPVPNRFGFRIGRDLDLVVDPDSPGQAVILNTASAYASRYIPLLTGPLAIFFTLMAAYSAVISSRKTD